MDPMEELNFKPINEGLGFHRKKVELKDEVKNSKVVKEVFPKTIPARPKENTPILKAPLQRQTTKSPLTPPSKDIIDQVARSFKKPNESFIEPETSVGQKPAPAKTEELFSPVEPLPLKTKRVLSKDPLPWMISPFFIDAMLVLALGLSCLLVTLLVTRADLILLFSAESADLSLWLTFPAIGLGMIFIYMTLTRLFLGASLGEIVFDLQLGTDQERRAPQYGFQVAFRSLLAIMTGLVTLPLWSLLTKSDQLGKATGLRLYNKRR